MDFLTTYNIAINPVGITHPAKALQYTAAVKRHLSEIYGTTSGKILLNCIKFHGKPVEITPFDGAGCNAGGGGKKSGGVPVSGWVKFSPDMFRPHPHATGVCRAMAASGGNGLHPDEVLFHELVHVFRSMSGKWKQQPMNGFMVHFTDTEEFLAVMITNIYISDRTNRVKSGLRAAHIRTASLGRKFTEPFGFFTRGTEVYKLVKQLYEENYGLFIRLANDVADAPFNPLADYLVDRERAEKLSKSVHTPKGLVDVMVEMMRI